MLHFLPKLITQSDQNTQKYMLCFLDPNILKLLVRLDLFPFIWLHLHKKIPDEHQISTLGQRRENSFQSYEEIFSNHNRFIQLQIKPLCTHRVSWIEKISVHLSGCAFLSKHKHKHTHIIFNFFSQNSSHLYFPW